MKILFFVKRFYPLIGGVEKHTLLLSKELIKRGYEITIVTEWNLKENSKLDFKPFEKYENINIYRIPITTSEKQKKFQIWSWLFKNINLMRDSDIVHCHDVFYWYLPFRFIFPMKKVYTTFHGYEGIDKPKSNQIVQHKIAENMSFGNLCIGEFYKKWYKTKPTLISFGAVDLPDYKNKKEQAIEYDGCFMGRLAEDVGIMTYLKALTFLRGQGWLFKLVVCGDGPQMQQAKEFVKKEMLDVLFTGFVNNPIDYLRKSKLAFISRYLSIIEAFVEEKPVFAVYNNEIKKDYLTMTPYSNWIWVGDDSLKLSQAILDYTHGIYKDIDTKKAKSWAIKQTWEKMTETYISLWKN